MNAFRYGLVGTTIQSVGRRRMIMTVNPNASTTTTTKLPRMEKTQHTKTTAIRSRNYSMEIPMTSNRMTTRFLSPTMSVHSSLLLDYYIAMARNHGRRIPRSASSDSSKDANILALSTARKGFSSQLASLLKQYWKWIQRCCRALWKALLVVRRTAEVVIRLSPLILLTPTAYWTASSRIIEWTWQYTIWAVHGMGPVAVKFCQWVATRRDIFPPVLCDRFSILHDQGIVHSWQHTDETLKEAFGDYSSKGLQLQEVIGCGSAAQVYKGTLTTTTTRNNNDDDDDDTKNTQTRTVAVKVLHPKFHWSVDRDLALMQTLAEFLHWLPSDTIRMMNLPRAMENFGVALQLQADLTNESKNLRQFRQNFFQNDPAEEAQSAIYFPQPLKGWSSSKVIVEDYVEDALPIASFLKDSSPEGLDLRRELAGPLLRAFLKMVFIDNFIHGDLHPGNVMVKTEEITSQPTLMSFLFPNAKTNTEESYFSSQHNNKKKMKHTIVFLDAGIANSLSRNDLRNLVDLFRAVIFNDGNRAGRLMVERAKYERCSQVPGGVDAFAKGVEEIVSEFHDRRKEGLTLGAVRIGGLLSRVLDLCRVHGVEIDPAMASVVISTLVLEGLGRSLSPELNLMDFAKPFVMGRGKV